jgi:beta-phosphoglucomutase-like phosphatase (HAD superfamily)
MHHEAADAVAPPPRAVVFDMDGVIFDSVEAQKASVQALADRCGLSIGRDSVRFGFFGRPNPDWLLEFMGPSLSDEETKGLSDMKETIFRRLLTAHPKPLPGLERLVRASLHHCVPVAVAMSAPPENVAMVLETRRLRKYFRGVRDPHSVDRGKPDPPSSFSHHTVCRSCRRPVSSSRTRSPVCWRLPARRRWSSV